MSFETYVTERLADLTAKYNALVVNAKRIFELPSQNNLDPASLIHVSRGGTSESLSVQKIIDAVSSGTYDQLLAIGEIELVNNVATIPPNAQWKINEIYYANIAEIVITIPYCDTGLERKDILVANTFNDIVLVQGFETSTGITIRPNVPINTVFVTEMDVTDSTVGEPTPPITGDSFVKKIEAQDVIIDYGATTVIEQINLVDDMGSISLTGLVTDIKSVQQSGEFLRPGKPHFVKNRTNHDVTIWHLAGTGNVKYFFPNELDLVIRPNEVIEFNLNGNDSSAYRFEVVTSYVTLQGAYDNNPEITTNSISGAVTIKQGSGSDTDDILVGKNEAEEDTFRVNGDGSVYSGDTALNSNTPVENNQVTRKDYVDLHSSPYSNSYVSVLQNSASIKNLYFKRKTEGAVFFALGMVVNGQAVQYDFRPDQDDFCKIGFVYSNTLSGSIMNESGRKTISANVLEYAIRMRKLGSVLGQNWIPNHAPAATGSVTNVTREYYIDGILTDVLAMATSNFIINEFTMIQKYNGCNIGDATPLFEMITTHKFKEGKLTITNNITVLQDVEMFQAYSGKITGYLANISMLKIDNDTKITPASTNTYNFYNIAAKSAVFYSDNEAISIEVGSVGESTNKNKSYGCGVNKVLYWDRALTPSIYWQWIPNVDNGGIAGTGTVLPIGTKLVSQNTLFTSTNINSILK